MTDRRRCDVLVRHATVATMDGSAPLLSDAAVAVEGDRVVYVGDDAGARYDAPLELDAQGALVTPGLVDCHTHAVFGGDRADEFEWRRAGATYEEIARAGGGIRSTVRATRALDEDALLERAAAFVGAMAAQGVTTVEVKSGYGLDLDSELRLLRAARRLGDCVPVDVHTTFLGAHTVPPEFEGRADAYVDVIVDEMLPAVASEGLADAVDAFLERIGFDAPQVERVFDAARSHSLPVKLHADQLSDGGGAALAARHRALSADHLEHTSPAGVAAMAAAGVTAVLLPGAAYTLGDAARPPVDALRSHGVDIAVASDFNPGTSPIVSLLAAANMACTLHGLSADEALAGITRNAARALGVDDDTGSLTVGRRADFVLWDAERPVELVYWFGADLSRAVCHRGTLRARGDLE